MHTQTIQTSHTNTHTHTALPVRPLPALLSVAPPKQVTRNSSPERNSLPFLPPFLPNEPLSLCTCVTRCPRATRTTFTHAHYRFSSPPPSVPPPTHVWEGGGGGEYKLHQGPQVMSQVSQWRSHPTWWPRTLWSVCFYTPPAERKRIHPSVKAMHSLWASTWVYSAHFLDANVCFGHRKENKSPSKHSQINFSIKRFKEEKKDHNSGELLQTKPPYLFTVRLEH